ASHNIMPRLQECQEEGLAGIPLPELLGYIRQAASAIDYLNRGHEINGQMLSIQHRDIKPENILLTKSNTVKVSDFGLAKVVQGSSSTIHADSTGLSLPYAAPEVLQRVPTVTRWTDQYSLALTYFKLRTGQFPFDASLGPMQVVWAHTDGQLNLSALPEAERAVISRATKL